MIRNMLFCNSQNSLGPQNNRYTIISVHLCYGPVGLKSTD